MIREEVERRGQVAHELRNRLQTALLSFQALRAGTVAIGGSTARCWVAASRASANSSTVACPRVRLEAGIERHERVMLPSCLSGRSCRRRQP